ncbi:MAG: hypothetical protein KKF41_08385 [Actinobacteria bacterium]|nr:hypothetical protein [Actinomycetota bacterium]MBU1942858.1 hypothetical protein [Actinomycetota bacterium]MBU2687590.1 hypothetical protein [Actinomycetota bacterium]
MSQESPPEETRATTPNRLYVEFSELSSKQRGAVMGVLKDVGFAPGEIQELVVVLPRDSFPTGTAGTIRDKRK